MSPELAIVLIKTILVPLATGLMGWALSRRVKLAKYQRLELINVQAAINIYKDNVQQLNDKIDRLTQEVHKLRTENTQLKQKIDTLTQRTHPPR